MKLIPVHDRSGIVAWTMVDDADFAWLNQWRWRFVSKRSRYVVSGQPSTGLRRMHRMILGLAPGDPRQGDHIDRNPLNNQRANLRIGTGAQNAQNKGSTPGSTSRFRGVYLNPRTGRWRACVKLNGRTHHLGTFDDEEEAGRAAAAWRQDQMDFA